MNKLMTEKKYEQVIQLFEKYLHQYKDPKSRTNNKFLFPHDQFVLVTIALYNLVNTYNLINNIVEINPEERFNFI